MSTTTSIDRIGIDLKGRVNRLRLAERNMLLPVFEAIVNSIHGIEDTKIPNGEIEIVVERTAQTSINLDKPEKKVLGEVIGFTISDNGIGFTDDNYESFKREYSTYKANRGGLGLGRFMWLKAFNDVKIDSTFYNNKIPTQRSFSFNLRATDGIDKHEVVGIDKIDDRKTIVKLIGYKDPYKSKCPKRLLTIADRIVEHCLIYFLNPKCPKMILRDVDESINLNEYFSKLTIGNTFKNTFEIGNYQFKITLLKWFEHEQFTYHKISLCANNREVDFFNVNKVFPDVHSKIEDVESGKQYLIVCYIEGDYFDGNVNDERTEIRFGKDGLFDQELISQGELYESLQPIIEKYFRSEIDSFKARKSDRISNFISEKAPQYRILNKYMDSFDDVVVTEATTDQELDLKLYKKLQEIEYDSRKDTMEVLLESKDESAVQLKEKYSKLFEELSDINKSKLAQYVVHRKYILELFEKSLALNEIGKYELEDTVHSIIYPTKTDSNHIDFNNQNLWIIDERLSFHNFLSSDKPLKSIAGFESDSLDRPDLMIFNNPLSYVEGDEAPFNSIVLVEFKRPMRRGYSETDDNPIVQLYNYVREIRKGKKLTADGRTYDIGDHTRFYCYLVCDRNEKIDEYAENAQFEKSFDGQGWYGYNKTLKCTIDIMPFNQVITNAKKRNKVLFHKLGI
ncbi:ATP-binding protein [Sphingobacterium faecium]|uniref:ATP-binding protein n=1 Tax=Sphingobacterium faecium TaxID=34087 RepID=UPI002478B84E|nr:ATP-binding protein [Sphingobacterium faecium]WGQ14754.1 ATP-binding protein [Sphingobacterium faecium]